MKSIIVSMVATAILLVAGGAMAAEKTPDAAKKPDAVKFVEMPALAKKFNCNVCHAVDKR